MVNYIAPHVTVTFTVYEDFHIFFIGSLPFVRCVPFADRLVDEVLRGTRFNGFVRGVRIRKMLQTVTREKEREERGGGGGKVKQ